MISRQKWQLGMPAHIQGCHGHFLAAKAATTKAYSLEGLDNCSSPDEKQNPRNQANDKQ